MKHLVLAGGVALNCVANGRLLREGPFEDIWIQPAAGDAGGALGSALFVWHQLLDKPAPARRPRRPEGQPPRAALLHRGDPSLPATASRRRHHHFADEARTAGHSRPAAGGGKVVGWFQGRMEFGPRALGARSILGDARSPRCRRP